MMSFCMVAAQGVMLPIALVVGWRADRWGRRPIFLVAFAALPIRAALYHGRPTTRSGCSACNCSTASGRGSIRR